MNVNETGINLSSNKIDVSNYRQRTAFNHEKCQIKVYSFVNFERIPNLIFRTPSRVYLNGLPLLF